MNFRRHDVSLFNIYNYVVLFIDKFLPNTFNGNDFTSLKCCFKILNILLRYHDPVLYAFLKSNNYPPEIYATSWFLTLFSNKLSLEMLYVLWDLYILEGDPYLVFFISLAILLENKNRIMSVEVYMIPQIVANIKLENAAQIRNIFKRAKDLKLNTPASFLGSLEKLDIFKRDCSNSNQHKIAILNNAKLLSQLRCIIISPYEVVNSLYAHEIKCSNPKCFNYKRSPKSKLEIFTGRRESNISPLCSFCKPNGLPHEIQAICQDIDSLASILNYRRMEKPCLDVLILDFRANTEEGILPRSHLINVKNCDYDRMKCIINDLLEFRGRVHVVCMTTEFNSVNFKNYKEEVRKKSKSEKSLLSKKFFQSSTSEEENVLFKFVEEFEKNNFPYLSVVEGGFAKITQIIHDVNLEMIQHNSEKCLICESKTPKKSLLSFFSGIFDKTSKTSNLLSESQTKPPSSFLGLEAVTPKNDNFPVPEKELHKRATVIIDDGVTPQHKMLSHHRAFSVSSLDVYEKLYDQADQKEHDESIGLTQQQLLYYNKHGIPEEVAIHDKDYSWFYEILDNRKFSYYICEHIEEPVDKETPFDVLKAIPQNDLKHIIIISKDILITVKYDKETLENLCMLKEGFSVERMLQILEEKRKSGSPADKKLRVHPKIFIESMFPLRMVLKITSKKANGKYISVYFQIPPYENLMKKENKGLAFILSNQNIHEISREIKQDNYSRAWKKIKSREKESLIQTKKLFCFDSENNAQEFIEKTKELQQGNVENVQK